MDFPSKFNCSRVGVGLSLTMFPAETMSVRNRADRLRLISNIQFFDCPIWPGLVVICCTLVVAQAGVQVQLGQNFTASTLFTDSSVVPPDTDGAVGPNHFVEFINGRFAVFDKGTGTNVISITDNDFWTNTGVDLTGLALSDTRVIYDPLSGHWFASEIDLNRSSLVNNRFLLGISATADPSGLWNAVAFQADPAGNFADFPRLGVDAKGVYLTGNMFNASGNLIGVLITSIPKADLLLSTPTATNRTTSGVVSEASLGFSLEPVVNFNPTNSAESVVAVPTDGTAMIGPNFIPQTSLMTFQVLGADTPSATFSVSTSIPVPSYLVNINPPQPDGQSTLDNGDARIGAYAFQVGDNIYAAHGVQIGSRSAIRWYRLSATNNVLLESGTISDTNQDLFYPSIAAATNGFVVIGFNGCSLNTFVSSYAAAGKTINGTTTFGDKVLLKAGEANYERPANGDNRWGDYSTTTVDVTNPNHFWTIQEYAAAGNLWATHVTELILTEVPPLLQIAGAGTNAVLFWPTNEIDFTLVAATNLAPNAVWSLVTNSVSVVGNQNAVTVAANNARQFFRLKR